MMVKVVSNNQLVDPKVDIVFKRIFGCTERSDALLDLTNAVLETFGEPLAEELVVLNPFIDPRYLDDKLAILDIKAKTGMGELINVEMQMLNRRFWDKRSLYYWSCLFDGQLAKGEEYRRLQKAIVISLLNFRLFDRSAVCSLYELRERYDQRRLNDLLQLYFIEFPKEPQADGISRRLAGWIQFFNMKTEADLAKLSEHNAAIREAAEMLIKMSHDPKERELYEMRRIAVLDYNTDMACSRDEGRAEGRAEGRKEGQTALLLQQAETRFGDLPAWAREKLQLASEQQIQIWGRTLLTASTLEQWLTDK